MVEDSIGIENNLKNYNTPQRYGLKCCKVFATVSRFTWP
jgi:hypothetical protein